MSGRHFIVQGEEPLLQYLFTTLAPTSRTEIRNMLSKGMIQVNGQSVTLHSHPLRKGDRVEVLPKAVSIARATTDDALIIA